MKKAIRNRVVKDMFTGVDGESYDIGRVLWAIALVSFVFFTAWAMLKGQVFDSQNFGIGTGAILGGGGAGVGMKAKTEPAA